MEEAKLITIEEEFLWKFVIMKPTTNIEGKEREKIFWAFGWGRKRQGQIRSDSTDRPRIVAPHPHPMHNGWRIQSKPRHHCQVIVSTTIGTYIEENPRNWNSNWWIDGEFIQLLFFEFGCRCVLVREPAGENDRGFWRVQQINRHIPEEVESDLSKFFTDKWLLSIPGEERRACAGLNNWENWEDSVWDASLGVY